MPDISYQLYCSRNFGPLEQTFTMLSDAGYSAVEGYGGLYDDAPALRAALDKTGLTMPTGHYGLDMVEQSPEQAIATAAALGTTAIYVPYLDAADRPTDAAGWEAFGKRLAEAGKPLKDAGLTFGWHNHDFEFADLGGDALPIELILGASDDLDLELDLGWVQRAGHDPVQWIARLGSRLSAAHIKDIAPNGQKTDEDGWDDVGHGVMDWGAIHGALQAAGVTRYVIEHDNPSDDARFARASIDSVKAW